MVLPLQIMESLFWNALEKLIRICQDRLVHSYYILGGGVNAGSIVSGAFAVSKVALLLEFLLDSLV